MPEQMRVLLIAEAANPELVSVPLVGWSQSRAIASKISALTVTQVRNREAFLRAGLVEGTDFLAIDSESIAGPLYKCGKALRRLGLGWTASTAIATASYYWFEKLVIDVIGDQIESRCFNLVHRITPLSPAIPSYFIAKACQRSNVPFVIGPINGGVPWPSQFRRTMIAEGEWLSLLRNIHKALPGYRRTRTDASAIITGSTFALREIDRDLHYKTFYIPENAIDPLAFSAPPYQRVDGRLKIAFIGRLVPLKGIDMILEACVSFLREKTVEVNIYGDGPQRNQLEMLAKRLDIEDGVNFHGWVNHAAVSACLAANNIFVFPSIREFGGGVVLESMATGIVPVVVDYGGPGELVTNECGFVIPMGNRDEIISGIRAAVAKIVREPDILMSMRAAGLRRVEEHFTWSIKADKIMEVYRWVLGQRKGRPDMDAGFCSRSCRHQLEVAGQY